MPAKSRGPKKDGAVTGGTAQDNAQEATKAELKFGESGSESGSSSSTTKEKKKEKYQDESTHFIGIPVIKKSTVKGTLEEETRRRHQKEWTRNWVIAGAVVLGAVVLIPLVRWGMDRGPHEPPTPSDRTTFVVSETKAYKALPQKVTALPAGETGSGTLMDLYIRANKPISDRFKTIGTALAAGTNAGGLTLISGIAGVGKSFMVRHLGDLLGSDAYRVIDLRQNLYKYPEVLPHVSDVGQLAIDAQADRWFNRMPALVDQQGKQVGYGGLDTLLRYHLTPPAAPSVTVLDSLDEIHPGDATSILELVESLAKSNPTSHFVVLGRPEAFRPFLTDSNGGRDRQRIHFPLNPPAYNTVADIETFVRDQEAHKGSPLRPEIRKKLLDEFASSASIRSCLGALALTNFCYESVQRRLESGAAYDEDGFHEEILQNALERNGRSHGRPSKAAPATLALYRAALEQIAVEYRDKVNDSGYFGVGYTDTVTVQDGASTRVFAVPEVLDFSGLVELSPADAQTRYYRFVPVWLHVHLLNSYQRARDRKTSGTASLRRHRAVDARPRRLRGQSLRTSLRGIVRRPHVVRARPDSDA